MLRKHCSCCAGDVLFAGRFLTMKGSTGKASELCFSVVTAWSVAVSTAEIRCLPHMQLRFVLVVHIVLSFFQAQNKLINDSELDLMQIFPPTPKLYDVKCINFNVKNTPQTQHISVPTKVLFLKGYFSQCLAFEVVMCHKNAKKTWIQVLSQIMFTVTKILDFRKRIKNGRNFSVCLNEIKEYNFYWWHDCLIALWHSG